MSSEEDEDYMSSDFLAKLEKQDIRPGLVFSSKTARKNDLEKRKRDADASTSGKKSRLSITMKESLDIPIARNNIGFAMLAKMGFKEGSGLGKSGDGIKEPVGLTLKVDRRGLGTEVVEREKKERAERLIREVRGMRDRAMKMQREQFRSEKQSQFYERRLNAVLRNNQKVCFQLDSQKGISEPLHEFFWPPNELENDSDNDEQAESLNGVLDEHDDVIAPGDEELTQSSVSSLKSVSNQTKIMTSHDISSQLQLLESYLRKQYFFCLWCSALFESIEDLQSSCPGIGPEVHGETFNIS